MRTPTSKRSQQVQAPFPPHGFTQKVVVVTVLVAVTIGLTACGSSTDKKAATTATATTATATTGTATTTRSAGSTTTTGATSTSPPAPTAAADLAPFFTAAGLVDARLKAAAALVNANIGPNGISDQVTLDAIGALNPEEAATAIPAGLSPELLLKVLIAQSDLSSRSAAFSGGIGIHGDFHGQGIEAATKCLKNGDKAAAQFASDLASAKDLAATSAPVEAVAPDSHVAGELAVRLADLRLRNYGCAGCGGSLLTDLAPVTWYGQPQTTVNGTANGDIGGLTFDYTYTADKGWDIHLHAC